MVAHKIGVNDTGVILLYMNYKKKGRCMEVYKRDTVYHYTGSGTFFGDKRGRFFVSTHAGVPLNFCTGGQWGFTAGHF